MLKKICVGVLFIFLLAGIAYMYFYWRFHTGIDRVLTKNQQQWLIEEMKHTPALPENIYTTMDNYFPDFYAENTWSYNIGRVAGIKPDPCQCMEIYLPYIPGETIPDKKDNYDAFGKDVLIKLYIEKTFSQKDCFTFNMNRSDFGSNTRGISEAALYYFHKELNQLTEQEIIGLYVIHKAPVYYSPVYNRKNFDKAVDAIIKK